MDCGGSFADHPLDRLHMPKLGPQLKQRHGQLRQSHISKRASVCQYLRRHQSREVIQVPPTSGRGLVGAPWSWRGNKPLRRPSPCCLPLYSSTICLCALRFARFVILALRSLRFTISLQPALFLYRPFTCSARSTPPKLTPWARKEQSQTESGKRTESTASNPKMRRCLVSSTTERRANMI